MSKTKNMILVGLFAALIAVGAFIRIPIPVVPFTLQILFTMLAGILLGATLGAVSVAIYIVIGLIGLPIFAGGGGFSYVFQPTFGYLIGFAVGAFVTGYIANRVARASIRRLLVANFIGLIIVYIFGMIYYWLISKFYLNTDISFWTLFLYCFLLAIPGDIVLCYVAAIVASKVAVIYRNGGVMKFNLVNKLKKKVMNGEMLGAEDALELCNQPLDLICSAANEIREHFCGNIFDLCTIINGKSGRCSEDCKYCAQSVSYLTNIEEYPLLETARLVEQAKYNAERGVLRYSIVTSGRSLCREEIDRACESIREIRRQVKIEVCASFGLLGKEDFEKLKSAGVSRIHCNLETAKDYFPTVCTTHTYDEKLHTLQAANEAGLAVCSGGIMGLGESIKDRIDMAICLRELGVKSVPINFLSPIANTPYENNPLLTSEEKARTIAIYRFLLPSATIRLAGGRAQLGDKGEKCFCSGANAAISGDMLTTSGISIDSDIVMIKKLGFEVGLSHE